MPKQKRLQDSVTALNLMVSSDIMDQLDILLHDPKTARPIYGAKTKIIEELLRAFVHACRNGEMSIDLKPLFAQVRAWGD